MIEQLPVLANVPKVQVRVKVNGRWHDGLVEPRRLLVDFLREDCGLTGTHAGCEHGVCGSCTVMFNGRTARACLLFAVQANGAEILTVEGLARGKELHPIQQAFHEHHGLQCGFCTPGMLITALEFLGTNPNPTVAEIREAIAGNFCRCTGYAGIVRSIQAAAERMRDGKES